MSEKSTATGRIRITRTPDGETPEAIRSAWAGLVLPCEPIAPYAETFGVISLEPTAERRWVVTVPLNEALDILAREKPFAAEWWEEHCMPPEELTHLAFSLDDVEILEGVERQEIIEVTDEMQGDVSR